jgi:hypothetical protein
MDELPVCRVIVNVFRGQTNTQKTENKVPMKIRVKISANQAEVVRKNPTNLFGLCLTDSLPNV